MSANKKPEHYLQQVHKVLSKDDKTTEKNNATLRAVLDSLCVVMKADPLFNLMFNRLVYTGSSYEGLRIRKADEFDINLVLKLPVREGEFQLLAERPGHVSYTITQKCARRLLNTLDVSVKEPFFGLFSSELKFQPQRLRMWFQGLMDKTLRVYSPPCRDDGSPILMVRPSQSGPAKTLYVYLCDGGRIDIDLVPVLEHKYDLLPHGVPRREWVEELPELDKTWFMVPKNPKDNSDLWRIHFPRAEKQLIKNFVCLKPTVRMVKAMKDYYKWKLSSYSIKTVVMRHRLERPDKEYWRMEHQYTVLLEVLVRLHAELRTAGLGICSLYDDNLSLIQEFKDETRQNIARHLERVINDLTTDPECALRPFLGESSLASAMGENASGQSLSLFYPTSNNISSQAAPASSCGNCASSTSRSHESSFITASAQQEMRIVMRQKIELASGGTQNQRPTSCFRVLLSVLTCQGRLLAEGHCLVHTGQRCQDHTIAFPVMVSTLMPVCSLVVKQYFEHVGEAPSPESVSCTLLVMMREGMKLAESCFYVQACDTVKEYQLRVPLP